MTRITDLYRKYKERGLSSAEFRDFVSSINDPDEESDLIGVLDDDWDMLKEDELLDVPQDRVDLIFRQIIDHPQAVIKKPLWPRIAAAASILFFLAGVYFLVHKKPDHATVSQKYANDVSPGHNQATLTLANGEKIILTKKLRGRLAKEGDIEVDIDSNQQLTYRHMNAQVGEQIIYNTLSTKIGEQSPYPLVLADGTKVWLNAASSITFPTRFSGRERLVSVTGEAYFEVVHNNAQPFEVQANGQTIEDIGTAFDVDAYGDEPMTRTIVLSGSVRVSDYRSSVLLTPGRQASSGRTGEISTCAVNTAAVIAWKNGKFKFDNENIRSIMRKISRWYNVDVVYEGDMSKEDFIGGISRYENISQVLDMLQATRTIHFKIEGRRITVMP